MSLYSTMLWDKHKAPHQGRGQRGRCNFLPPFTRVYYVKLTVCQEQTYTCDTQQATISSVISLSDRITFLFLHRVSVNAEIKPCMLKSTSLTVVHEVKSYLIEVVFSG